MKRHSTATLERWKPDPCYLQLRKSKAAMQRDETLYLRSGDRGLEVDGEVYPQQAGWGELFWGLPCLWPIEQLYGLQDVQPIPSCPVSGPQLPGSGPRMCGGIVWLKDCWPSEWEVTRLEISKLLAKGNRVFSHDINMD